jgi:hypothetical protein
VQRESVQPLACARDYTHTHTHTHARARLNLRSRLHLRGLLPSSQSLSSLALGFVDFVVVQVGQILADPASAPSLTNPSTLSFLRVPDAMGPKTSSRGVSR